MVHAVVVVAQHRHDAIGRMQFTQYLNVRQCFARSGVDHVAGEHDEVGVELVDAVNHVLHERCVARVSAKVYVGYLYNAVTLESRRQSGYVQCGVFDLQFAPTPCCAIHLQGGHAYCQCCGHFVYVGQHVGVVPADASTYDVGQHKYEFGHCYAYKQNEGQLHECGCTYLAY